jgi:SAM-dependent methyltransferase
VQAYQEWLARNGGELYRQFYSRYATFEGCRILDLACGYGGKFAAYSRLRPRFLCGIDHNVPVLAEAQKYSRSERTPSEFVGGDVARLPFKDGTFDVVISDDGFDHFTRPDLVLDEIRRVLRPNGTAFVSFVPYYSRDCSHMEQYLRVPWHHVLFSRRALLEALNLIAQEEAEPGEDPARIKARAEGVFSTFRDDLSRLSLAGFERTLRARRGWRLIRLRKQCPDWARPLTYVPVLKELVTHAIYCVLVKDEQALPIRQLDFVRQAGLNLRQDVQAVVRRLNRG